MANSDDFVLFSEKDKDAISYGACVLSSTAAGVFLGSLAGGVGGPAVGAAGLLYGLMICPTLQRPIKQKLFSKSVRLTDQEINLLVVALRTVKPSIEKRNLLLTLGLIRNEAVNNSEKYQEYLA